MPIFQVTVICDNDSVLVRRDPVVTVEEGSLAGQWEHALHGEAGGVKYAAFRGVPFAAPPVDALRFKVRPVEIFKREVASKFKSVLSTVIKYSHGI